MTTPPLSPGFTGDWHAARRHCRRSCFCYHATWRLFRTAGVKGSPAWHERLYRKGLDDRAPWWPSRVLVCGSSDETMPRVLAGLTPTAHITVADACQAPLDVIRGWANQAEVDVTTIQSSAPELDGVTGRYDLAITDGLLSLLPDQETRDAAITRLAGLLAPDGLLLYTTRIAGPGGRLEYDRLGRAVQAAAAAFWFAPPIERWRLAQDRWLRPSRPSPYTHPAQVADAFFGAFEQVRLFTRTTPPTPALSVHPAFLARRGSVCVGVAATNPRS
ncbi:hypothetical protein [Planotetraspora sp. GP83]|uniref:hypothetical protein n=1 Tax=Planotetraspora sp. GP83 TaxID=3156264 RepID=UPI003511AD2E